MRRLFSRAALMVLLLLMTSTTAWANTAPWGYVDRCKGYQGSIYFNLWALDPDDYSARVTIHVYLYQDGQQKYFYNLGPTDLYRDDTVNPQYAGYHQMKRYIDVPVAGTYNVRVYALDTEGGTNSLLKHPGNDYSTDVDVTTSSPYTVTYNANGGSGAPAATTKGYGIDLTLSTTYPTRSGYHFMGWNTAANGSGTSYAAGGTYTANANLTLYAQWEANDLPGNGTVADPYIIRTTAGWNTFACSVNSGTETYAGKTVMLATDVSVSMMVGTGSKYNDIGNLFCGTFDGCGHTLNLNIQGGSSEGAAPFHYIGGATIKNVKTTGTVSGANHCSGLVGFAASNTTNTIQSCWVDADITCSTTHAGGILGWAYCATVRDCLFSGSITGSSSYTGIIYGWGDDLGNGATHTIINCLAAGTYTNCGGIHMLVRYRGTESVTNCYKTQNVGSSGTYTTATGETLRAMLGDGWEVRSGNVVPKKPSTYLAYHTATHSFVELSAGNPTIVGTSTTTMGTAYTETVYMVNSNVTISSRITVNGTVHLILADGATLTASQGITVSSGNTLNIYGQTAGTGTLNATGVKMSGDGTEAAAIGSVGTLANVFGTVTIHGGRITADGAAWSAGIGGGVNCGGGSVTIYGGSVNAIGHDGVSEAIGKGSGGTTVSKTLIDGLRVTVNNNSTPVSYNDRVSSLSQKIANVEPCTEHNFSNNTCAYCGLALCHVTYEGNNATSGTAPTDAIAYASDQTVTVLGNIGNLARTGYTFAGWNTQANGSGTTYTAGATFTINGNTTLYAKWTPITYTVRFNKNHNDVTGTMSNQTFTYDVAQPLTTNAFTRDGWYFVGWSTETNGSSTYTDGQSIINLATEQDDVVNLYALWVQTIYTISYDLAGGTVATPNPTTYHELSGDITLVNPTKAGYYFVGWTGTGLTEPSKTVTIPVGSTGNRTYTATWIETPLTEDTDEAEGTAAHWYVNMPATDTKTVTLSDATVTTFKVYDDGGKNGNYSSNCSGYLVLTAPAGYVLQLSGSITSEQNYDKLTVYDGTDTSSSGTKLLNAVCSTKDGTQTAITPVLSSGQSMTLYFYDSHNDFVNYTCAGLDLTVRLIDSNVEYDIDIVDAGNNNTLTASVGGNAVTTAKYTDVVTLTASPASGYLLKDFSVVDASGNDMSVTDMRWYTGASTATFTMPASAVTVTSTFTNTWTAAGGLYINMPATGTETATIPAGVQSFKVYDDGGQNGNYSINCSGYLVLTAPTGYVLQLSGSITTYYDYAKLTVYDGTDTSSSGTKLLNEVSSTSNNTQTVITPVVSSGQSMTLYFYNSSRYNTCAGLDLTVTLLPVLELANNADNSDAISAAAGNNRNVTLADRTIYCDGDWNTLVLPFDLDNFTGTPLEGATVKTLASTDFNDGTLTMNFSDDLNSIDAGVPYIVKWDDDAYADLVIRSASDWDTFATNVNNGTESYAGKTVKLAANISVSQMVGVESHKFQGTFDGGGHTLNVSLSGGACTAPFSYVGAATIRNLKVAGSVTTTGNMSSGLVGFTNGALTITNCVSSVTFTSSYNGNSANGGIIGLIDDNSGNVTIEGCAFTGKILTTNGTTSCGGIVGWRRSTKITLTIKNCLYAPAALASGETEPTSDSKTICRYGNSAPTITNCYYTRTLGDSQGTDASGMSNETLASNLGNGWEVSGGNVVPKMAATYSNIVNPVFKDVTISNTTANVETDYVDFVGTYSPVIYSDENKSVLFLGGGSTLYYPDGTAPTTIGACRGYFTLKGITAGDPATGNGIKAFVLNFGDERPTLVSLPSGREEAGAWYDLGGRKVHNGQLKMDNEAGAWYDLGGRKVSLSPDPSPVGEGRKLPRGVYIHNGKKVVIK